MKNYFIVTLLHKNKYKLYGQFDPSSNILLVSKVEQISKANGMYDREKLVKEISIVKQNGFTVLIETRNRHFQKYAPIIMLEDRGDDSRPLQDIYFQYFKSHYYAQELDVGAIGEEKVKFFLSTVKESYDPRSGKIQYEFRKFDNEFRAVILLLAAHTDPPKGVDHFLEIERSMNHQPKKKSKTDRIRHAVGLGWDEQQDAIQEELIKKTQQNFKY
jgi:hypothetical protein